MAPRRRGRLWLPFTDGATVTVQTTGSVTRLFLDTVMEVELGRQMEGYTIERILLNMYLVANTVAAVVTVGIALHQEDVALTSINPEADQVSDWLYLEEFVATVSNSQARQTRDIRSKRISRGRDTELYLYTVNRSSSSTVDVHMSGRVLVLLP